MASQDKQIAVIGAGPAGVAAAFAIADSGHSVILIDRGPRVGGSVIAAMHRCLCGLYSHTPQSPLDTLNAGAQRAVVTAMLKTHPRNVTIKQLGKTSVLEFPAEAYESALLHLCTKPDIQRRMNTKVTAVKRENNRITAVEFESRWIEVQALIDCTGSGAAMQLIGEDVMHPPDPQRMLGGYSIRLTGITGDAELLRLQLPYVLAKAVKCGDLPAEAKFTMFHPGPAPTEGICKLAINPDQFSSSQIHSLAVAIVDELKSHLTGFSEVIIAEHSPRALPRDGRRLKGKATVTEDDVLNSRRSHSVSVHAWWPIERWDLSNGPSYAYPPPGRHYDIPINSMRSAVIENLFAAGTCVSATASAAASLRASGICLATGHAAGLAAAEFIRGLP